MRPAAALVEVRDLAKRYGDAPVFEHVDLEVAPGEFVAIVGESGVGKSTLLNCIAGLDRADAGRVRIDGADIDDARRERRRRCCGARHLGFVFQAFHVLPHLTVAQNVALPLLLLAPARRRRASREVLDAVGLGGFGARLPRDAVGRPAAARGDRARAGAPRRALVLADEPTGNLDPRTAARVIDAAARAGARAAAPPACWSRIRRAAAARADRVLRLTRRPASSSGVTRDLAACCAAVAWPEWRHHPWRHGARARWRSRSAWRWRSRCT